MLNILYEDKNFIGFDKPNNIHTTYGKTKKCFIDEVKKEHQYLFDFTGYKKEEGGLLYRLDNETSGLLLFAKNKDAFDRFIKDENLKKIYHAKVSQTPNTSEGCIDYPIAHKSSLKMVVVMDDRKIKYRGKLHFVSTCYKVIADNILKCTINKGIRHQIRVHLAVIGSPIIGDQLYGSGDTDILQLFCVGVESKWLNISFS